MAHTYSIGLPVAVTVNDDGTVDYFVDLAEAGVALQEDDSPFSDAEVYLDAVAVEADLKANGTSRTVGAEVAS